MSTRNEGLSNADFDRLRALIYQESGINLNSEKKTMLEIRLRRRLRSLDLSFARVLRLRVCARRAGSTNSST